jgi:hypothetical protein
VQFLALKESAAAGSTVEKARTTAVPGVVLTAKPFHVYDCTPDGTVADVLPDR